MAASPVCFNAHFSVDRVGVLRALLPPAQGRAACELNDRTCWAVFPGPYGLLVQFVLMHIFLLIG